MTTPLLIGNWKSNTSLVEATNLLQSTIEASRDVGDSVRVGVAAPFPWLPTLATVAHDTSVSIGAQTSSATGSGAYTGEVTAEMLQECCSFVLVGHSERRSLFGETDDVVQAKLTRIIGAGLTAVLCVGEVLQQRESGHAQDVVKNQLLAALDGLPFGQESQLVIAYEPVWAIGTGECATPDDAEEMCAFIRLLVDELFGESSAITILYGGSANEANAEELLRMPHVEGLLIGGASLKQAAFREMIKIAAG